ncbi:hypothetical protein HKX48_008818, partial [Thoreauomyces humboldtii]
ASQLFGSPSSASSTSRRAQSPSTTLTRPPCHSPPSAAISPSSRRNPFCSAAPSARTSTSDPPTRTTPSGPCCPSC